MIERQIAIEIARDAASPKSNPSASFLLDHGTGSTTPIPLTASPTAWAQRRVSPPRHSEPPKKVPFDVRPRTPLQELGQQPYPTPDPPYLLSPVLLHSSRSSPGLTHMISHKLSTTFSYPTVVHRPNKRSKPSGPSLENSIVPQAQPPLLLTPVHTKSEPAQQDRQARDKPVDTTDPSSHNTSGNMSSPREGLHLSTAMTSLMSDASSRKISDYRRAIQPLLIKSKSLSCLEDNTVEDETVDDGPPEPPVVSPSMFDQMGPSCNVSSTMPGCLADETRMQLSSLLRRQLPPRYSSRPTSTASYVNQSLHVLSADATSSIDSTRSP